MVMIKTFGKFIYFWTKKCFSPASEQYLYSEWADNHNPDHSIQNSGEDQGEWNGHNPRQGDASDQTEVDGPETSSDGAGVHQTSGHARPHHAHHLAVGRARGNSCKNRN